MPLRNTYISASAGAGKTYQLVNRYLSLLSLQQLEKHQIQAGQIIAITFTRKAAGEFKSRILSELADAASSASQAEACWNNRIAPILRGMQIAVPEPSDLQGFFTEILAQMMEQFAQLNLSTIDSLLQRIAQSLCSELGLARLTPLDPRAEANKWRHALDVTYEDIFLRASSQNNRLLVDALTDCLDQNAALSRADSSIFSLVKDYHENLLDSPHAYWGGKTEELTDEALAAFGLRRADIECSETEESWKARLSTLHHLLLEDSRAGMKLFPEPQKIEGEKGKFSFEKRAKCVSMHALSRASYRKKFIDYIHSLLQLGKKPLYIENKELPDASPQQQTRARYEVYWDICAEQGFDLDEMLSTRDKLVWRSLLNKTQALYQLLHQVNDHYTEEVRSQGLFSFGDVSRLLLEELDEQRFAIVQERLDMQLQHWLLDEFQDTSHGQYGILRDLLQARAQEGDDGSVFMVGDAKQSIYGFRGGDPEIFLDAREELFGLHQTQQTRSEETPLNTSYRSSQDVLNFANELFGSRFRDYAPLASEQAHQLWEKLHFEPHSANQTELSGSVEIWRLNDRQKETGHVFIAELLSELRPADAKNQKLGSCAILTRSNAAGVEIYEALLELQEEYGFAGPIFYNGDREIASDAPLGLALMQLFRWLLWSGDRQSLQLLQLSPLWQAVLQLSPINSWQNLREIIAKEGLSELLRQLSSGEQKQLVEHSYLQPSWRIWVDEAAAFDESGGTLSEWVEYIEQVLMRDDAQGKGIQIMTIHKSKGLEFDSVILPYLSIKDQLYRYDRQSILYSRGKNGSTQAAILPPKDESWARQYPDFYSRMIAPSKAQLEFGAFCELYVALTRAKRANYIILHPESREEARSESFRSIMAQLEKNLIPASTAAPESNLASCSYHSGNTYWYKESAASRPAENKTAPTNRQAPLYHFAQLARRSPSQLDEEQQSSNTGQGGSKAGIELGNAIHHIMQHVDWVPRGEFYLQLPPAAENAEGVEEEHRQLVLHALNSPAWQSHFLRPQSPHILYREQNIEALLHGSWVSGQIDRLLVHLDAEGKPCAAHIYDFKTNAVDCAEKLLEHYSEQMKAYKQMCALALQLAESSISVTLLHCPRHGNPSAVNYH